MKARIAHRNRRRARPPPPPAPARPFSGRLMIADRGNNRLIVVNAAKKVLWRFPSPAHPAPPGGFYFPDDAFFIHGGTRHHLQRGAERAHRPALLPVRKAALVLRPSGRDRIRTGLPPRARRCLPAEERDGHGRRCAELPRAADLPREEDPRELRQPGRLRTRSATRPGLPQRRHTAQGRQPPRLGGERLLHRRDHPGRQARLVLQLPIEYPSDPQQLGPDRYLVADYTRPGGIYEFNRAGKILWSYHPSAGPRMLNHPSLAERLPNGLIAVNDDYRARVVIINPRTRRIVWQYGHHRRTRHRTRPAPHTGRLRPPGTGGRHPDPPLHRLSRPPSGTAHGRAARLPIVWPAWGGLVTKARQRPSASGIIRPASALPPK